MGYTKFTKELIQKILNTNSVESVLDLGACNDYDVGGEKPPYVRQWYYSKGIDYSSIDLAGDDGAWKYDLGGDSMCHFYGADNNEIKFDLVVDAGTSEHVVQMEGYETVSFHQEHIHSVYPQKIISIEKGYYNCWLNKFNLCKLGGFIISENPKTGSWPSHGYTYVDFDFYWALSRKSGLYIGQDCIGEHAAMGNTNDGWNIWCIMKKVEDRFPSFEEFKTLPLKQS